MNELLDKTKVSLEEIKTKMKTRYNLPISDEVVSSVLDCLNFRFHTVSHNGRIVRVCDACNYNLFKWENGYISTCTDFERLKLAGKVKEYFVG